MSFGEVVIGEGRMGCSAIHLFNIPGDHSISENSTSFWISECILKTNIVIFKNTSEGMYLQKMIEEKEELAKIQQWIDMQILKHIDPANLIALIEKSNKEAFSKGKLAKLHEIRSVLELVEC